MTFEEYDRHCHTQLPIKLPKSSKSARYESIVGDCLYFNDRGAYRQRDGVHDEGNVDTDLSGAHVLLSDHFFYFGDKAIELPAEYRCICHPNQGHKVNKNEPIKDQVVAWLEGKIVATYPLNSVLGTPLNKETILAWHQDRGAKSPCATARAEDDESDPSTIC